MVESRFRFLVVLAGVMVVATVLVSSSVDLPLLDPDDDATGPAYVRFPLILLAAFLVDVVPRVALRWGRARGSAEPVGLRATVRGVLRERWTPRQVRFMLVGLAAWYVTYATFRNLKNAVPFVNDTLWDSTFASIDRWLFFGHDPAQVLHSLFGTSSLVAHFFSFVYVAWIVLIPVSLAWALVFTRHRSASAWFVTAIAVDWALGAITYFAFPTLGPIYSDAGTFAGLPHTMVTDLEQGLLDGRIEVLADPVGAHTLQSIAAFASLHVGLMMTMCLVVQLASRRRSYKIAAWAFLGLTSLGTVYLGWHFAIDTVGGVLVGTAGMWIAALGTGNHVGWRPALVTGEVDDEPVRGVVREPART
ncbi:hypothetical protein GCM10011519_34020 [Marmoricola endophyticus]|uniref:Inositolphosphotransferase Aur1/Ipt1 domain-containing protein n=1 Tax=Marmoricola endophyticus TaxID=2040280 RepID=A0A917BSG5_9ACTN|nr:phosphatase PAP2 family protein [Marmoricola endophyticus]GGF57266.1 hypothetical protein GCM10011519_34020 [Marmoricola endophyticus]